MLHSNSLLLNAAAYAGLPACGCAESGMRSGTPEAPPQTTTPLQTLPAQAQAQVLMEGPTVASDWASRAVILAVLVLG